MSQAPNPNMPLFQINQPKKSPQMVASAIGVVVLAFVQIVFWIIVAIASCATGWLALKVIVWACRLAGEALGL